MELAEVSEGMHVRLLGPEDHPLHGVTGVVGRVMGAAWMWRNRPSDMMDAPFAWTDGQVLVSLDNRPRLPDRGDGRHCPPWCPLVIVRPEEIEAI